jgi:hypothetical protein
VIRPWRLPVLHLLFIPMIYKQADCRHLVIGGYPSYIVVFFTSCQLARNGRLAVFIFFLSSLRSRNLHLFFPPCAGQPGGVVLLRIWVASRGSLCFFFPLPPCESTAAWRRFPLPSSACVAWWRQRQAGTASVYSCVPVVWESSLWRFSLFPPTSLSCACLLLYIGSRVRRADEYMPPPFGCWASREIWPAVVFDS